MNNSVELPIDWDMIHRLSEGDSQFERELLTLFLQDMKSNLGLLTDYLALGSALKVREVAHHIKGASANVGAGEMHRLATALEMQARYEQLDMCHMLLKSLQSYLDRLEQWLQQEGMA
jgi:HPt (histidine-containing phosphotransfer) domain-containing protein